MEDIKLCPFCESPMLIVDDGKTTANRTMNVQPADFVFK